MTQSSISRPAPLLSAKTLILLAIAASVGFLCLVIPPHLIARPHPQGIYPTTLMPWFESAAANIEFKLSAGLLFALGMALGISEPERPALKGAATIGLFLLIHTINVAHDLALDKTTHNLLPLEYVIFGVLALPAMAGAWVGGRVPGRLQSQRDETR